MLVSSCVQSWSAANNWTATPQLKLFRKCAWCCLGTWQEWMSQLMPGEFLTAVPQSDWKRPAGHPHTSWLATVKNDLSYHNLSVDDATELALDRPLWRLLAVSRAAHWNGASWTLIIMFIDKLSQTCYGELTPYVMLNSSVLRWMQKQDDDEDKSWTAAGREFQAAGPQTAKLCDL